MLRSKRVSVRSYAGRAGPSMERVYILVVCTRQMDSRSASNVMISRVSANPGICSANQLAGILYLITLPGLSPADNAIMTTQLIAWLSFVFFLSSTRLFILSCSSLSGRMGQTKLYYSGSLTLGLFLADSTVSPRWCVYIWAIPPSSHLY